MLSGRMPELQYLNQHFDKEGSQILIVYGQKHIGKTALAREFAQDKPNFYYLAKPCSEREQRYQMNLQLGAGRIIDESKEEKFPEFSYIFDAICGNEVSKKVIIIDEFQNIVRVSDTFMTELVRFAKAKEEKRGVSILLCSSSIGWIENSMAEKIGAAASDISGMLKLEELPFTDVVNRFPDFRIEECVEAYAILGGMPGLWNQFDDKLTIQQNICRNILNPNSFLFEEGERMVTEQLRETSVYNTILATIASGSRKLNDIYTHTEFSRAKISVYLKNLIDLGLVEKVFSYKTAGRENVQKGIYRISNPFVDFYFTYLYPHMSALQTISVGEYYNEYIYPKFRRYVSGYFKKACRQHLERQNERGKLPFRFGDSGEWIGKEGTIDVIAQSEYGETLIALCNWEKPMMTYEDYRWVLDCAQKAKIDADYIYLYTASGFDEKLNLEAKIKHSLKLVQITDI